MMWLWDLIKDVCVGVCVCVCADTHMEVSA